MVQGYLSQVCSSPHSRWSGQFERKCSSYSSSTFIPSFGGYSYFGGSPYEQWHSCSATELNLRWSQTPGREVGGFMLSTTVFIICAVFMICVANMNVCCCRKKYILCLFNKAERIVVYCYEDGSLGRDALRHILGNHAIKALQSDGYNVYMYLDHTLVDIEHFCCMAHARAKFKHVLEQCEDIDAAFFLDCMGELYKLEAEYKNGRLSPDQIKICRNSLKTKEIIIRLRSKLDALLNEVHPPRGDLMEKVLRYLNTFWSQSFAYTHAHTQLQFHYQTFHTPFGRGA